MKKKIMILLFIVLIIATCGLGFFIVKNNSYNKLLKEERYTNNTKITVNDWSMYASSKTAEEIYQEYLNNQEEILFTIILKGQNYTLDITDCFSHSVTKEDFADLVEKVSLSGFIKNEPYEFNLNDKLTYNKDAVQEKLSNFLNTTTYEYIEPQNAYFNEETYEIIDAINGTKIVEEKALTGMIEALNADQLILDLDNEIFYEKAEIQTNDIEKEYSDIISIYNWSADYSVVDHTISMKNYMDYVTKNEDGTYSIDTSFMKKAVLELSKKVDNAGTDRVFKSTLDGTITVAGGTYGQIMNNKKEIEYLIEKLENRESVPNRIPIWKRSPESLGSEDTYVEIDLSAQHVWYYVENELIMETDCVTGTKNTTRATPTGSYFVSEKVNGKYLTGATWRTWVDKWMRLTNDGVGLHDAQWRKNSEFGGNTYTYDGSHGCINLPKDFAYELYDLIEIGTLVVIHE